MLLLFAVLSLQYKVRLYVPEPFFSIELYKKYTCLCLGDLDSDVQ